MPDPPRRVAAFEKENPAAVDSPRPQYDRGNDFLPILTGDAPAHVVLDSEHALGLLDARQSSLLEKRIDKMGSMHFERQRAKTR